MNRWIFLILFLGSTSQTVSASESNEWTFEVTPYLWAVSQDGDTGARNVKGTGQDLIVELDMSFSDIFDNLDEGYLANGLAKKGDWLLFIDNIYMRVKVGQSGDGLTGIGKVSLDITAKEHLVDMVAAYRTIKSEKHNFYTYLGVRYADVDTTTNGNFTPLGIPGLDSTITIDLGENWVEPMLGGYSTYKLTDTYSLISRLEVGGFGIGSDLSWQASFLIDQKLNEQWSLKYSYRHISIDYDDNDFVFDVNTNGLLLGATYKF